MTGTPPALVLLSTIGTDDTLWTPCLPNLPPDLAVHTLDLPGHGAAPALSGPGKIGAFITHIEARLDELGLCDIVLLGHGLGGLVAQGLAAKRLDIVRALILSGTATKIETRARWEGVATSIRSEGAPALVSHIGRRWSRAGPVSETPYPLRTLPAEPLAQAAEAVASADFFTTTAALRLPALIMVGAEDAFTPPDLARETANLIPGSNFVLVPRAGHLAMLDAPVAYTGLVTEFLHTIGHLPK